jgi:hypothetical protein
VQPVRKNSLPMTALPVTRAIIFNNSLLSIPRY